jgi:hypothetical protein
VSLFGLVGAVLVGTAFGYGAQRGAFCMCSGLRGVLAGEWTKVKALGLAVAVQLLLLPIVFGSGLAESAGLPLQPIFAGSAADALVARRLQALFRSAPAVPLLAVTLDKRGH